MAVLGGGRFLMSEVPLQRAVSYERGTPAEGASVVVSSRKADILLFYYSQA